MKKKNFAICDPEMRYAEKLMNYITEKQNIPFQVLAFSDVESLRRFTEEHEIELLLISSGMMSERVESMKIRRIMILSEGEMIREYQDYPVVYKYRSSDSLVAEVMNVYVSEAKEMAPMFLKREAEIYGVYSPVGRCGKTIFALTLGQILAQRKSVLYLNLEECAGFRRLMGREYQSDITDMMYFIRQNKGNAIFKMNAMTQKLGNLDYIPPAFASADLQDVKTEEWMNLIAAVTSVGGYECLIIDMGGAPEDRIPLLTACSQIYTPTIDGVIAQAKIEQYERWMREMGYEELLDKTRYLKLPFEELTGEGEYYWEQLMWSELGDFIRDMCGL